MPNVIGLMKRVIDLAARNVANRTGGPFGAAVFARESGLLIAVGVNSVIPSLCSHAHAEMVALAQQRLKAYDLGATGFRVHELVTPLRTLRHVFWRHSVVGYSQSGLWRAF